MFEAFKGVAEGACRSEGCVQGLLGALGVQEGPKIIRGAAQRGIGTVSAGVPCQAGAVQARHTAL